MLKIEMIKSMDTQKSFRSLSQSSLHSLRGFNAQITSTWVDSVCNIINTIPSEEPVINHIKNESDEENDLENRASKIKDELHVLTATVTQLNIQRRQVLNELLDLKGNIRVFCRIRPFVERGKFLHPKPVVAGDSNSLLVNFSENKFKAFSFDKVFTPTSSQDEVFVEVEPIVKSALDGYNACIFAYGQTGTGKTFSMEGTADFPGIVPRSIEAIFLQAAESNHKFLFTFSMLEIYMGHLKDLLIPRLSKATDPLPPCLSVQTSSSGEIEIENLVAINVNDFNQALKLYRLGRRFRSTGSTESNKNSSRSHCMIRISMSCIDATERRRLVNKLWLVDLGGSERVLKTKATGRRFDEGKAINLSLSALGDVIHALQTKTFHIPYRNSKLTQVLQDSLGEDSKTLMLVHVSPQEEDLCETISSLSFATRARSIHLGNKESNEARVQKEFAMSNLQQKVKQIEDKRNVLRGNINTLNEKLEKITGVLLPSPNEQHESSNLLLEEPRSSMKTRKIDVIAASSSNLPRFMRPTVCSRRKTGPSHQIPKDKPSRPARRKKPPLGRAESVSFPINRTSECNSESSISRTSCFVKSKTRFAADNQTEYSQDTFDCDTSVTVFTEQDRESHLSLTEEDHEDRTGNEFSSRKLLEINHWFHSHEDVQSATSSTYWNKRVQAIPAPGSHDVLDFRKEKADKATTTQESISEAFIEVLPGVLEEISEKEVTPDDTSRCYETDCTTKAEHEFLNEDESVEDIKSEEATTHCEKGPSKSAEYNEMDTITYKSNRESQLGLASDKSNQEGLIMPDPESENDMRNSGICYHLKHKIKIFCASLLLGLGIRNLGYEHDFFSALML